MRRTITALLIFVAVGTAAAQKKDATSPTSPTYDQVVLNSKANVGKAVTWVVRSSPLGSPVSPDGSTLPPRTVFELRSAVGEWQGRLLLGPAAKDITFKQNVVLDNVDSRPLVVTAVVDGMGFVKKGAMSISVPLLRDVTIDMLPAELEIYEPGKGTGTTWPEVLRDSKPKYTRAAMDAKIQGTVELIVVVKTDGSVGDVVITKSLEPGLDQAAVDAAKQWKFRPGLRDGKPVLVRAGLVIEFRLH